MSKKKESFVSYSGLSTGKIKMMFWEKLIVNNILEDEYDGWEFAQCFDLLSKKKQITVDYKKLKKYFKERI